MEVLIFPDSQSLDRKSADLVEISNYNLPRFGYRPCHWIKPTWPVPRTLQATPRAGVELCQSQKLLISMNMWGIPDDHPQSYRTFMNKHLFKHIDIDLGNTHVPNGMAENPLETGPAYEQMIEEAGGIDLQVLGVGTDGHIGFNEPTSSLGSVTRVKTLTEQTFEDNSALFHGR